MWVCMPKSTPVSVPVSLSPAPLADAVWPVVWSMDHLFTAMAIFIEYPFLAALIGVILLALGWYLRRRTLTGIGIIWLLYAGYETGMQRRWLCSGECDIRIDLLVIYPILVLTLTVAGVSLLLARKEWGQRGGRHEESSHHGSRGRSASRGRDRK